VQTRCSYCRFDSILVIKEQAVFDTGHEQEHPDDEPDQQHDDDRDADQPFDEEQSIDVLTDA